ncbi:Cyanovirin-N [Thozetella sp. PMI_491]|nr:Cyanovirin-N [Thozetella sp. PMI_491]
MQKLAVVLALVAAQAGAVTAGNANFTSSCTGITLDAGRLGHNDFLNATCASGDLTSTSYEHRQPDHVSEIDLNLCVGIDQSSGNLAWSVYGKFSEYCKGCSLARPAILSCTCAPIATGVKTSSTLNLNEGIGNVNGSLICLGGKGS